MGSAPQLLSTVMKTMELKALKEDESAKQCMRQGLLKYLQKPGFVMLDQMDTFYVLFDE